LRLQGIRSSWIRKCSGVRVPYAFSNSKLKKVYKKEDLTEIEAYNKRTKGWVKRFFVVLTDFPFRDGVDAAIKEGATP
jgi:hypothetical protein